MKSHVLKKDYELRLSLETYNEITTLFKLHKIQFYYSRSENSSLWPHYHIYIAKMTENDYLMFKLKFPHI